MYLPVVYAACLADIVYSFSKSAKHACFIAKSFSSFLTLCRKTFLKMRKNPNKNIKNVSTPAATDSENESVCESSVPDKFELPVSVVGGDDDRPRPVLLENKSSDVRERPEFKKNGWASVKEAESKKRAEKFRKYEEDRKKKAEEYKKKAAAIGKRVPLIRVVPQQFSTTRTQNGPRRWGTQNSTSLGPQPALNSTVLVEQRSRSPVKKVEFKAPAVTKAMVKRNTASVSETLQHRWSRLGGPQLKPAYTRSYTQTREDPMVRNEKLNGKKSVGIKVQTRLDEGILVADVGTGDYLRGEFVAHQELPKIKAELASKNIEFKHMNGLLKELKEKLVVDEVDRVKKDMILKKTNSDREFLKKKYAKSKERKNELKKLVFDLGQVTKNELNAAARKNFELERENRALRLKMSMMKTDHEEMLPVVNYDTDGLKSEDEEVMSDGELSEMELVETDSDESENSEHWDLFLERKTE